MENYFNLENLFSKNTKIIQESFLIDTILNDIYDLSEFEKDCDMIEQCINDSYRSNDEDIEDLEDVILICETILNHIILDEKYDENKISKLLKLRKHAKKLCNQKYRDYKYDNRQFWNFEEASYQYSAVWDHWRKSTDKIKKLLDQRFPPVNE